MRQRAVLILIETSRRTSMWVGAVACVGRTVRLCALPTSGCSSLVVASGRHRCGVHTRAHADDGHTLRAIKQLSVTSI
eukprot:102388-Prymnesium_polylepis.1